MKIIGVTGPSGSGKGVLCHALAKLGYIHLDTDIIYHDLLLENNELKNQLVSTFGNDILTDGNVDRKKLGKKVFGKGNERKLLKLNKISHKFVCRAVIKIIMHEKDNNTKGVLIDAPLLIESRLDKICDLCVAVICPVEQRICRIVARDNIDSVVATLRVNSQKADAYYIRNCQHIFFNDNSLSSVEAFACELDKILGGR